MAGCRMGRWSPIWKARSASCKVDGRRFRVALLPTKIPASREPGLQLNPQLRRIPAEMRADLTSAEIAARSPELPVYFREAGEQELKSLDFMEEQTESAERRS